MNLIAQYKFDKYINENTLPEVNDGFKYIFKDTEDYNVVTRSIYKANTEVDVSSNIVKSLYSDLIGCPTLLENGDIQFTSVYWNCCTIDLSGYKGKTVNISLTVTGKPNHWMELDVGFKENGEMTYYEMEIGADIGETEQTFTYNKSFIIGTDTSELLLDGMYMILSDIQIIVDNENLFPNRIMNHKYKLYSESGNKYYSGMPLYKDNKLDYVQNWDNLYIDVHQYKGKDITISFTATGYSNAYNWSELEIGKRNDVDNYEYYEQSIIAADLDEDYTIEYNKTFTIDEYTEYIYFGGIGVKISNLSMIVHVVETEPLTMMRFGWKSDAFGNFDMSRSLLEVSYLDTSSLTNMYGIFFECCNLTKINTVNWDTSDVTDMSYMFYRCYQLTSLDVSGFDTSKVTTMKLIFGECINLNFVNLNNWNINVSSNLEMMFNNCTKLNHILMNNSDYNSINKVITQLSTRTTNSPGTLNIAGVDDKSQVDINTAESKNWTIRDILVMKTPTLHCNNSLILGQSLGTRNIKAIYLYR